MKFPMYFLLVGILASSLSFAKPSNKTLAAVMSSLALQMGVVTVPTKAEDPTTVDDKQIGRSAGSAEDAQLLLQLVIDLKGAVVDGKLQPGQLTPPAIADLPVDQIQKKLADFEKFLTDAKAKFAVAQKQLEDQGKAEKDKRDFTALAGTADEIGKIIKAAHEALKPKD